MAAEQAADADSGQPEVPQDASLGSPAGEAQHEGGAVEADGGRVGRGVHQAHALLLTAEFRPVDEARHGGGGGPGQPESHQHVGLPGPARLDVQHGGGHPAADGQVDRHRVHGVAEPRAVEHVPYASERQGADACAERVDQLVAAWIALQRVQQPQHAVLSEEATPRLVAHVR